MGFETVVEAEVLTVVGYQSPISLLPFKGGIWWQALLILKCRSR